MRLLKDSSNEVNADFNFKEWIAPAKDWETWAWAFYCLVRVFRDVIGCLV